MTKTCAKCGKAKTVDHFTRTKKSVGEFDSICRACRQLQQSEWRSSLGKERYIPETAR